MHLSQGFSPKDSLATCNNLYPATTNFPELRKEYVPFIEEIGGHIGMIVRKRKELINAGGLDGGIPKIRLLMASLQNLPTKLMLPKLDGDFLEQNLEFSGLLNQYFHCKQLRRFLQQCPKRKNWPRMDNGRTDHVASQEGGMEDVENGEKGTEASLRNQIGCQVRGS